MVLDKIKQRIALFLLLVTSSFLTEMTKPKPGQQVEKVEKGFAPLAGRQRHLVERLLPAPGTQRPRFH